VNPQTQVVFYIKNTGVISSSFPQGEDNELLKILNPGSKWIASQVDGGVVVYKGSYYYVRNMPLPSYDGTVKLGALVLFPIYVHFQFALFALLTAYLLYRMWLPSIHRFRRNPRMLHLVELLVLGSITICIFFVGSAFYGRIFIETQDVAVPELGIYNSTMQLFPDSGVFDHKLGAAYPRLGLHRRRGCQFGLGHNHV
jgi:hypothetical protein